MDVNEILMNVQRQVEQEYLQRLRRDIRQIEHLKYISIVPVRPKLVTRTVDGDIGECTVCLGVFKEGETIVTLECNDIHPHTFHRHCIIPWLRNHDTCPTCRGKV